MRQEERVDVDPAYRKERIKECFEVYNDVSFNVGTVVRNSFA